MSAQALELSNSLDFGVIDATQLHTSFLAETLSAELQLTEAWSLSADASLAHYLSTATFQSSPRTGFGLGTALELGDAVELDLALNAAPVQTILERDALGGWRTQLSSYSAALSGSYEWDIGELMSLQLEAAGGAQHYSSQDVDLAPGAELYDEHYGLWQLHGGASASATIADDTELALSGAGYGYVHSRAQSGLVIAADGMPLEPLLFSARAAVSQRISHIQVEAHGQYGGYLAAVGRSWNAGVAVELTLTDHARVALGGELRLARYRDGSRADLYISSLAAHLSF